MRVTQEIKGKEFEATLTRILASGKAELAIDGKEDGTITKVTLKAGPEELELAGRSYGEGNIIARATIREEDEIVRVTFDGAAKKRIEAVGGAVVKDFKKPLTGEDAKAYADTIVEALGLSAFGNYKLEKVRLKPDAAGGEVVKVEDMDLPF